MTKARKTLIRHVSGAALLGTTATDLKILVAYTVLKVCADTCAQLVELCGNGNLPIMLAHTVNGRGVR